MSSKSYDIENFLRDAETLFRTKLNEEITNLNTEKSGETPSFTIDAINADAFYNAHIPRQWSYPIFVVFGVLGVAPLEMHEVDMLRRVNLFFEVCVPDEGDLDDRGIQYKLLRYMRACERVVLKNPKFASYHGQLKLKVNALTPATFGTENKRFRSAGVEIEGIWGAR